ALPSSFGSPAATFIPPRDPSFDRRRIDVTWSTNGTGRTRTGRFDLDNDGGEDEVRITPWQVARDHILAEHWEWTGASGQTHRISGFGSSEPDDREFFYVGFVYKPVRWRSRTALYARMLPISTGTEEDSSAEATRAGREQPLTRGLIELLSNGSARLLCAWAP